MSESDQIAEHDGMTARQRAFVQEYPIDLNQTRAAIRAGYSPNGASQQGSDLLRNPVVAEAIAVEMQARATRVGVTAEKVLRELAYIAFSDITQIITSIEGDSMTIKDLKTLEDGPRRSIESITVKSIPGGVSRSVKLHSKVSALKLLLDHLGVSAPQKVEVSAPDGLPLGLTPVQLIELANASRGK